MPSNKQVSKVELAEFLAKEGAYEVFDATEVTEVRTRFDKDGNGFLRYRSSGALATAAAAAIKVIASDCCVLHQLRGAIPATMVRTKIERTLRTP